MLEVGSFRAALHGGVSRRAFLAAGALAPAALGLRAGAAEPASAKPASVILLWLWGAPSHLDTFDPKPKAAAEIRGPFGTIQTRTPSVRFTELFPKTAARSDQFALIRSMVNADGDHLYYTMQLVRGQGLDLVVDDLKRLRARSTAVPTCPRWG